MVRGPNHPHLGTLAAAALGDMAGAISPGATPKDPPSLDPNEDGFLLHQRGERTAMLVVDGAGGFEAAGAVIDAVRAALTDAADGTLPEVGLAAWRSAIDARNDAASRPGRDGRRPHVAASLVVTAPDGSVWCSTMGDTAVLAVGAGRIRLLSGVAPHLDHRAPLPQPTRAQLADHELLVAASDGFFDALGLSWTRVVAGLGGQVPPEELSRDLVAAALDRGGDDHVSVVVHAPRRR